MKLEQVFLMGEAPGGQKISHQNGKARSSRSSISSAKTSSQSENDLCHHSESFRIPEMGVPISDSSEKKLSWLRSQIIGGDVEFDSPFGKRRLTYADHTASGRCLHYIEDYIIDNVLPFYGKLIIFIISIYLISRLSCKRPYLKSSCIKNINLFKICRIENVKLYL